VEDPTEYLFTGHREVKKEHRAPFVDIDEMLLSFGHTKKAARRRYLCAITAGIDLEDSETKNSWHPFDFHDDRALEIDTQGLQVDSPRHN